MAAREVDEANRARSCSRCPNRMSKLKYDKHSFCSSCRQQVCDLNTVCDECKDWPTEFRKIYVAHQRTLVSKRKYKTKIAGSSATSPEPDDSDDETEIIDSPHEPSPKASPEASPAPVVETHTPNPSGNFDFQKVMDHISTEMSKISQQVLGRIAQQSDVGLARRDSEANPSENVRPNPTFIQVSEADRNKRREIEEVEEEMNYLKSHIDDIHASLEVFQLRGREPPQALLDELANKHALLSEVHQHSLRLHGAFASHTTRSRDRPSRASPAVVTASVSPTTSEKRPRDGDFSPDPKRFRREDEPHRFYRDGREFSAARSHSRGKSPHTSSDSTEPRPGTSRQASPPRRHFSPRYRGDLPRSNSPRQRFSPRYRRDSPSRRSSPQESHPRKTSIPPDSAPKPDTRGPTPRHSSSREFPSPSGKHKRTPSRSPHASGDEEETREEPEPEDSSDKSSFGAMTKFLQATFPKAVVSPVRPPSAPPSMLEAAGISQDPSQPGNQLAWFEVVTAALEDTQKRCSRTVGEGKPWSTILAKGSKHEIVGDSPSQGRELKINPSVYDLLRSKVFEKRLMPLSLKEGANLEKTLRHAMESHSFLLWSVTALMRTMSDRGNYPQDDPLLDQIQKSISKSGSNVASALATSTAFVSMKRRETLLQNAVPAVTDAQKRKLYSDPLFQTKDLFEESSLEVARTAARDVSLFRPHLQQRPSSSSPLVPKRPGTSSGYGKGRGKFSTSSLGTRRSPRRSPTRSRGGSRFNRKPSDTPRKRGGFRK